MKKSNSNNNGFTLIELLVAMAAFSFIIVSMTGIAHSVIKGQRKAFALQDIQESTRYSIESMSKEIRMSEINSADSGSIPVSILNITNEDGDIIDYQFISDKMQRRINLSTWQDVSPSNVDLTGWFNIQKESFPKRALVTIIIKAESQGSVVESQAEINLQSTVISRVFQ